MAMISGFDRPRGAQHSAIDPVTESSDPLPSAFDSGPRQDGGRPWGDSSSDAGASSVAVSKLEIVLEEFTRRWERLESPRAEDFIPSLPPDDPDAPLELIYHEYCLASSSGHRPDPEQFVRRFPQYRERVLRLIALHDALPSVGADPSDASPFPEQGDSIGPYRLIRELGRGGFARVYLASDAELEDRLVVIKITDRPSAEHRYLARAPHPHIVPILRERTTEEGLQLIFMPFVGGGTLADVLLEGRQRPSRPDRGTDLLTDLDLRSAPEYKVATSSLPARELLSSLTYSQAIAWIIARLAEGLDHAYQLGVTHGDLKPSNILIGGDGQPMLLDFNLSTDWRPCTPLSSPGDPGGTLAYMAPERLWAIANPEEVLPPSPRSRHTADLYALGLILLEALTGQPPQLPPRDDHRHRSVREMAALLATERSRGNPISGRRIGSIPPGLRAILRRCLASAPADRYENAAQLASDLDRWRAGQLLMYSAPPKWVEALRWVRLRRRPLLAAALSIATGLVSTGVISGARGMLEQRQTALEAREAEKFEAILHLTDPVDEHLFAQTRPREKSLTISDSVLRAYRLFEPGPDFWSRPDVLRLQEPHRSDLRALIFEHGLLYALAATTPDFNHFPDERIRALELLDRLSERFSISPIQVVRELLREQLGLEHDGDRSSATEQAPRWLSEYLNGVLAESLDPQTARALEIPPAQIGYRAAMRHYMNSARSQPGLYFPHYRLAAVAGRIKHWQTANEAIEHCLDTRPDAAALWLGSGSYRYYLGSVKDAMDAYQRAVRFEPLWESPYRNLALLGAREGRQELIDRAIQRFRIMTRPRGPLPEQFLQLQIIKLVEGQVDHLDLFSGVINQPESTGLAVIYPSELGLRYNVGCQLQATGRLEDAIATYTRILDFEPNYLPARFNRAVSMQRMGRKPEALDDYRWLSEHPNFEAFVDANPTALMTHVLLSAEAIRQQRDDEAIQFAEEAVKAAQRRGRYRGEAYYALARALASAAESEPTRLVDAAKALNWAGRSHPSFLSEIMPDDPIFERRRAELAELLEEEAF